MSDTEVIKECWPWVDEIARLRAINAELLAALEWIADQSSDIAVVRKANEAIEKGE